MRKSNVIPGQHRQGGMHGLQNVSVLCDRHGFQRCLARVPRYSENCSLRSPTLRRHFRCPRHIVEVEGERAVNRASTAGGLASKAVVFGFVFTSSYILVVNIICA